MEDIARHVSRYEPDFPIARVRVLIALADRKILWYLTGEVNRNPEEVAQKLAALRERRFTI